MEKQFSRPLLVMLLGLLIPAGQAQSLKVLPNTPNSDGDAYSLTKWKNGIIFSANSDTLETGIPDYEPWVSDGTETGTYMLKDLHPTGSSAPNGYTVVGDNVFFYTAAGSELWVSDGTRSGTRKITGVQVANNPVFKEADGKLLFWGYDSVNGREPWISDGTEIGTYLLRDINPGVAHSQYDNQGFFEVGNYWCFTAQHPDYGVELWRTDGTGPGTVLVRNIISGGPPEKSSRPSEITQTPDGTLYFWVNSGSGMISRYELWKSNGTYNGTRLVKSFATYADPIIHGTRIHPLGDRVIHGGINEFGMGLWISDGTAEGTEVISNFGPASVLASVEKAGVLYMLLERNYEGYELWRTDGTEIGTYRIKDIYPGEESGVDSYAIAVWEDYIYFIGNAPGYSYYDTRLWRTDGTETGTVALQTAEVFASGHQLTVSGEKLFMLIDHPVYGYTVAVLEDEEEVLRKGTSAEASFPAGMLTLYPVPSSGNVWLRSEESGSYAVYDQHGIVHKSGRVPGDIELNLPEGMFFAEVVTDSGVRQHSKIIVRK